MRRAASILIFLIVAIVAIFVFYPPGFRWKVSAFRRQMQQVANPHILQEWAITQIANAHGQRMELTNVPHMLVSPTDGAPKYLVVHGDVNPPCVVAQWGDGFGHWGLVLGDALFPAPSDGDYYLEWQPGVYVWHEIQ